MTTTQQHTTQGKVLVADDIVAAREDLIGRGLDVGEIWHLEPGEGRVPGLDPQRRSYFSRASFADPEGRPWVLEEVTERLPGRAEMRRAGGLARLLFETAKRHGAFDAADWWDWYAAYLDAREAGDTPEQAAAAVGRDVPTLSHAVAAFA
jgi:hypothetical protein